MATSQDLICLGVPPELAILLDNFPDVITTESELIRANLGSGDATGVTIARPITLSADLTISRPLEIARGGIITTNSHTLTISSAFSAGAYQCFSAASGEVVFNVGSTREILPEWWGAIADNSTSCASAINSAIASCAQGGYVQFSPGNYRVATTIALNKEGVILRGSGTGNFTSTGNEKGSNLIWNGSANILLNCTTNEFNVENLGFDGGGVATVGIQVSLSETFGFHNILVRDCLIGILLGNPLDLSASVSGGTFNYAIARNNGVGIKALGNNTENISFFGGIVFDNDTYGVWLLKGGLLFSGVDTSSNTTADYFIDPPAAQSFAGLTVEKGFSEASGIFLLTTDFDEASIQEKPISLIGCRVTSKDGSDRNVYHQSTMPLTMIANEFNGKYESTGKTGTAGPPVIVDIGNSWGLPNIRPTSVTILEATKRGIRTYNRKELINAVGATTPITVALAQSGQTWTNYNAAGLIVFNLPAATPDVHTVGSRYRFIRVEAFEVRLEPNGSDVIRGGGAGKYLSMGSNGASVNLTLCDTGRWEVESFGTITFEP